MSALLNTTRTALALLCLVLCGKAVGQTSAPATTQAEAGAAPKPTPHERALEDETQARAASAVSAGGPLSAFGNLLGGAEIMASKGDAVASLKASLVQSLADVPDRIRFNTWSLSLSGPLNKNGGDTALTNRGSFSNAVSLEGSFSRFTAPKAPAPEVVANRETREAICRRAYAARLKRDGTPIPEGNQSAHCDSDLVQTYGSAEDLRAFEGVFLGAGPRTAWLWGGSAKFGYEDLEHVTAADAIKHKQNEEPWSVGLWFGVQPGGKLLMLTASMKYAVKWESGDATTVCPAPATPPAPVSCVTGALNAPLRKVEKLLTLEARGRRSVLGGSLSVTRDFEARTTLVEVPIYFVGDKDAKLTAGVKPNWHSEKGSGFVFFVGTPFGIYK